MDSCPLEHMSLHWAPWSGIRGGFLFFFVAHSWQCPGLASGSVLREDSLRGLKGPFVVLEIKLMSASCKTSALPPMLTLQPPKIVFFSLFEGHTRVY